MAAPTTTPLASWPEGETAFALDMAGGRAEAQHLHSGLALADTAHALVGKPLGADVDPSVIWPTLIERGQPSSA